jgi:ribonucleotide reductase alpha subunit
MQGGSRRSAIFAGLHWDHQDAAKFIEIKNWDPKVRALKEEDYTFPATLDGTNVSIILDDAFFKAYHDEKDLRHSYAQSIYWATLRRMLKTAEPGFSVDTGANNKENLRNACQPKNATVLTPQGIRLLGDVNVGDKIWGGHDWTRIVKKWSTGTQEVHRYSTTCGSFLGTAEHRIVENCEKVQVGLAESIDWNVGPLRSSAIVPQDVMDGLAIGDGTVHKASGNLVGLDIGSRDQEYFDSEIQHLIIRPRPGVSDYFHEIETTITAEELPRTFIRTIPDRFYFGNPSRKASFLRGLFSANGSVVGGRVTLKQSSRKMIEQVQEMLSSIGIHSYVTINKGKMIKFSNGNYQCKKSYDLNITSGRTIFRDAIGFIHSYKQEAIKPGNAPIHLTSQIKSCEYIGDEEVFDVTVDNATHTYWTGGCLVSNCTEVTSSDDSDICNLGSINLARIDSLEEMKRVTELSTAFLLAGTVYSDVPYSKVDLVRTKNRRLGLGLMGIHEWLLKHGKRYGPDEQLGQYLDIYKSSGAFAKSYSNQWDLSVPIKTRAIAPTGTIGIIAETTTGIEPIFCVAYKRRYYKGSTIHYQYVLDPTAKKLIDSGIDPEQVEDAYTLAENVERRVAFQAWVQTFVDHGISSTINLPAWGSEVNNQDTVMSFGNMLMKYLPNLRGVTAYPDGARGGQPLSPISYRTASKHVGEIFVEQMDVCELTSSGSCGV